MPDDTLYAAWKSGDRIGYEASFGGGWTPLEFEPQATTSTLRPALAVGGFTLYMAWIRDNQVFVAAANTPYQPWRRSVPRGDEAGNGLSVTSLPALWHCVLVEDWIDLSQYDS